MKKKIDFLIYNECKKWVKDNLSANNINTRYDWNKIKNELPEFVPKNPKSFYIDCGWSNWDDFLDIKQVYLPYDKAKLWVHNNLDMTSINTIHKWKVNTWQLPEFIPKVPDSFYKNTGWIDWNYWLLKKNKYERV